MTTTRAMAANQAAKSEELRRDSEEDKNTTVDPENKDKEIKLETSSSLDPTALMLEFMKIQAEKEERRWQRIEEKRERMSLKQIK